jgi:hypothetical protein
MYVCRSVPCKTCAPSRLFLLPSLNLLVDARAFLVFALSLSLSPSLARSRDATRHKLRSQINNAAVLLVPSRPCTRHYRRRSSPVAVYYGPGTLSVAWNAGSCLDGFGPESFQFTNCCLLQSARTLSIAWNAGSLLDGFGLESSSSPIVAYYRPRTLWSLLDGFGLESLSSPIVGNSRPRMLIHRL